MPDANLPLNTFIALPPGGDDFRSSMARIHDAHPGMGRRFFDLFLELMVRPGPLRSAQRELVAVVVASEVECHY